MTGEEKENPAFVIIRNSVVNEHSLSSEKISSEHISS
jgi:hypothetical protein